MCNVLVMPNVRLSKDLCAVRLSSAVADGKRCLVRLSIYSMCKGKGEKSNVKQVKRRSADCGESTWLKCRKMPRAKKIKKVSESILSQPQLQADKKNKQHQIRRFSDRKREKGGISSNMHSISTDIAFRFGFSGMALSQLRYPQYDRRVATHLQGSRSIDRTMGSKAFSETRHDIIYVVRNSLAKSFPGNPDNE